MERIGRTRALLLERAPVPFVKESAYWLSHFSYLLKFASRRVRCWASWVDLAGRTTLDDLRDRIAADECEDEARLCRAAFHRQIVEPCCVRRLQFILLRSWPWPLRAALRNKGVVVTDDSASHYARVATHIEYPDAHFVPKHQRVDSTTLGALGGRASALLGPLARRGGSFGAGELARASRLGRPGAALAGRSGDDLWPRDL